MPNRVGNKVGKLIGVIFLCYWIYTVVSVLCLDRSIAYYRRSYAASSLRPVMGVIAILYFLHWISGKEIWKKAEQISQKRYYGILAGVSIAAFIAQVSYQMTKKKTVGMGILAIGILLFDFSYRTFVPYTDNYSVLFLTLTLYVYFNQKFTPKWIMLGAASIAMGCFIKITSAILLIAGIIVVFLYRLPEKKKFMKSSLLFLLVFVCVFGGMTVGCKRCLKNAGFVENTDTKWGLWHYFMMGQNEETLGAGRKADREYSSGFETLEERNAANRAEGIKRIANRGIRNNILFYTYKNFQNYDDGCFAPVQKTIKGTKYGNSFIERIFIKDKQYYYLYALLEQTLWLLVLALVLCGALLSVRQDRHILFLQMVILGVSAYVLLFEGRAKYLFMFVPVYLLLAAVGLRYILHRDL